MTKNRQTGVVVATVIVMAMSSVAEARSPKSGGEGPWLVATSYDNRYIDYPRCPDESKGRRTSEFLGLALTQPTTAGDVSVHVLRDYRGPRKGLLRVRLPSNAIVQPGDIYLASGAMTPWGLSAESCEGWVPFREDPDAPHKTGYSDQILRTFTPLIRGWLKEGHCATGKTYKLRINIDGYASSDDPCLARVIGRHFSAPFPPSGPVEISIEHPNKGKPSFNIKPGKHRYAWLWDELTNPLYFGKEAHEETYLRLKLGQETPKNRSKALRFLCEGYGLKEAEEFFKKRIARTDEDSWAEMVLCALNYEDYKVAHHYAEGIGGRRGYWLRNVIEHAENDRVLSEMSWSGRQFIHDMRDAKIDWASSAFLLERLAEALVDDPGPEPQNRFLAALSLYRANEIVPSGLATIRKAKSHQQIPPEALPEWEFRDVEFGVPRFGREAPEAPSLEELRVLVAAMEPAPAVDVEAAATEEVEKLDEESIGAAAEVEPDADALPDDLMKTEYLLVGIGLLFIAFGGGFLFGRKK